MVSKAAITLYLTNFITAYPFAELGGPIVCTYRENMLNNCQVTKDCCAAVRHNAYFNEAQHMCMPRSGAAGNSVDTGEMVKCCESRGFGSNA
jgi:hypothetical protein